MKAYRPYEPYGDEQIATLEIAIGKKRYCRGCPLKFWASGHAGSSNYCLVFDAPLDVTPQGKFYRCKKCLRKWPGAKKGEKT